MSHSKINLNISSLGWGLLGLLGVCVSKGVYGSVCCSLSAYLHFLFSGKHASVYPCIPQQTQQIPAYSRIPQQTPEENRIPLDTPSRRTFTFILWLVSHFGSLCPILPFVSTHSVAFRLSLEHQLLSSPTCKVARETTILHCIVEERPLLCR